MNKFQRRHLKTIAINTSVFLPLTEIDSFKKLTDLINDDCSDLTLLANVNSHLHVRYVVVRPSVCL